jgi:YbgC/YbaW family acyl-CoA thioester hydrolase
VEFSDTDAGGVMHFSRFFIFMENAEDEFLRAAGSGFTHDVEGKPGGWPKAAVSCEYLTPARHGDVLEIHLRVTRMSRRAITYGFTLRRGDVVVARGSTTSVCCALGTSGRFEPVPLPAAITAQVREAPES